MRVRWNVLVDVLLTQELGIGLGLQLENMGNSYGKD